jgi:RNA polymerase sigma factor (sigma-70 family)
MDDGATFSDLFRRARAGDPEATEALYDLALRLALRAARKRLRALDRALLESQDLRQSVLLRLHRRLPDLEFEEERDLAAWLAETTKLLIREKRRNVLRDKRDARRSVPLPAADLPDLAARSIRSALVRLAVEESLEALGQESAAVVRLHVLEGRTFQDVADRLGLPGAEAARKRYARALVKLGGLLDPGLLV